jgi:hypothetical protein
MENIIDPNEYFDFTKLSLTQPVVIQGGAFFTKILYNNKPLYLQSSKSQLRQGFVKTGKKYYCDLMYDNNSNPIIHWFEKLEENCIRLIHEKSDTWFENALEKSDVETAFNSIIRIFKSGKYYLVRTNVKSLPSSNEPAVKIYNENEISIPYLEIKNENYLLSILEIQGIKFTTRNFQIDIELKQIMVLDNEQIFDNCLIKSTKKTNYLQTNNVSLEEKKNDSFLTYPLLELNKEQEHSLEEQEEQIDTTMNSKEQMDTIMNSKEQMDTIMNSKEMNNSLDLIIEELEEEDKDDLKEINFDLPLENQNITSESITLKKPNQVYFELYKSARTKAKEAKRNLILAYLEAKNIKKTYMLDNLSENSDSDLDAEIDDISESELEGL